MDSHTEWNKHITLLLRIASEKKVPEWRFGQLIENLKRYMGSDDLFYVEDWMLAEAIIKYFDLDEYEDFQDMKNERKAYFMR